MLNGKLVALGIILICMATAASSDDGQPVSTSLLRDLNAWLDTETGLARRASPPRVVLVTGDQAERLRGVADRSGGRIRGLYSAESGTIYLTRPWSSKNLRDVSILLHELVHHRQAEQHWYCPQAQEWDAYRIQAKWLTEKNLEDDFYWPAILLQSSCTKRDIHPD